VEQPLPKNVTAFYLRTQGEAGQTLAEFSLLLALVAILCIVVVTAIGVAVVGFFTGFLPAFH
jgi:Flp pilus assembly pilin Flp